MPDRLTNAIARLDPQLCERALARFVEVNPHYQGGHWEDVVDELFNADALLDLTDRAESYEHAVALVTRHWAGTLPTIQTVCRVHIPSTVIDAPGIVSVNPLVGQFLEWTIDERIPSVPGTMTSGPHMLIADYPIEYQDRIVAWFAERRHDHQVSHGGVRSDGC